MLGAPLFRGQEISFVPKPSLEQMLGELVHKDQYFHLCDDLKCEWRKSCMKQRPGPDALCFRDLKHCHLCGHTGLIKDFTSKITKEVFQDPASSKIICQNCVNQGGCTSCKFRKAMSNPISGKSLKKWGYFGKCTKEGGPEKCQPRQGDHRR